MKSNAPSKRLNLERDLPTSAEDIAALRRVGTVQQLNLESYILFLSRLPKPTHAAPNERRGWQTDRPFKID